MLDKVPIGTVLPAADLDRARKWYSEKLGLEPVTEDEYLGLHYESGGREFTVYQSEFAGTNKATAAGWNLDNFDEMVIDLRERGVEFEEVDLGEFGQTVDGVITAPDGKGKAAWFKDSEGNILSITTM